ncbi:hypothetical protein DL93DRAFT_582580 [Clavulina sp. PMI_390]|nr:hypothetical protein DL93DRAFT_582580 [Clavulina sp. PMI_390]
MVSANVEIHHQGVVRRKEFTVDQSFSWASLVDKIVSKFKLKEKPTLLQYTFEGQSYDVEDDEDLEVLVNRKTDEKLVLIHRVADVSF